MDGYVLAWRWLAHGAVGGLIILGLGSLAAWLCRQPVRRARIVVLTLIGGFAVPWLGLVSIVPRWSAGIVLPVPRSSTPSAASIHGAVAPALTFAIDRQDGPTVPDTGRAGSPETENPPVHGGFVGGERADLRPSLWTAVSWELLLLAAYAAFSVGWAAWWLLGHALLWRIVHVARPVQPQIQELFNEVGGEEGDRVAVLESETVKLPFTFTWLRPVIVLPSELCGAGDSRELRFCLAHEWSHIERDDARAWNFATFAGIVLFYQPLFWWLRRQLRLCQDYLADDRAAALSSADDYAAYLVHLARLGRTALALPALRSRRPAFKPLPEGHHACPES